MADNCHFTLPTNRTSYHLRRFFEKYNITHRFNSLLISDSQYFTAPVTESELSVLLRGELPELHAAVTAVLTIHRFVNIEKKILRNLRPRERKPKYLSDDELYFRAAEERAHRLKDQLNFNDPLAPAAWQLLNDEKNPYSGRPGYDLNVYPVYLAGYTGKGVKVIVVDDAVDNTHKDLAANIDMHLTDDLVNSNRSGPRGTDFTMKEADGHGTMCASVVAAVANNSLCSFGVSFKVKLGAIRLLGGPVSDLMIGESFVRFSKVAQIYTSSWGPTDDGEAFGSFSHYTNDAIIQSINKGNGGKGVLFFFPAGNGGFYADNCGADGFINHFGVFAVTAIDEDGESPEYTESCSAITFAVPTTGTPLPAGRFFGLDEKKISLPAASINNHCTDKFIGTSAANPIGAGCAALALEANPNLSWRDVQSLFSFSGRIPVATSRHWFVNGAGMLVNPRLGSGLLNVARLVNLALKWTHLGPQCVSSQHIGKTWNTKYMNKRHMKVLGKFKERIATLRRGGSQTFIFKIMSPTGDVYPESRANQSCTVDSIELVRIHMQWAHWRRGALKVCLESPSGLRATLLDTRVNDRYSGADEMYWKSLLHTGESTYGIWKIKVYDKSSNEQSRKEVGFIKFLSIEFRGTTLKESAYMLNKKIIVPHWTHVNFAARKSKRSHPLSKKEVNFVYNFQRWDALNEKVLPKEN